MKALIVILLLVIAVFALISIYFFFVPEHNPFIVKAKLRELEAGQVLWIKDSPKKGHGHAVAVIREITKDYIYYDLYELRKSKPYTL